MSREGITPDPRKWIPLLFEEVEEHRWIDCPYYDRCLGFAALKDWEGWTCSFCPLLLLREEKGEEDG